MSLQNYRQEELEQMPMVEIANLVLFDHKEALHYKDMFLKVVEAKGYASEKQIDLFAQFYTDLNMDGRFITTGDNLWGLKRWYPADQIDEQVSNPSKKEEKANEDNEDEKLDADDELGEEDELVTFDEDIEDKDFEEFEEDEFPAYTDDDDE